MVATTSSSSSSVSFSFFSSTTSSSSLLHWQILRQMNSQQSKWQDFKFITLNLEEKVRMLAWGGGLLRPASCTLGAQEIASQDHSTHFGSFPSVLGTELFMIDIRWSLDPHHIPYIFFVFIVILYVHVSHLFVICLCWQGSLEATLVWNYDPVTDSQG